MWVNVPPIMLKMKLLVIVPPAKVKVAPLQMVSWLPTVMVPLFVMLADSFPMLKLPLAVVRVPAARLSRLTSKLSPLPSAWIVPLLTRVPPTLSVA